MKNKRKLLLFLTLLLVCALLFSSIPAWAGELGYGKSLAEARKALEQELLPLSGEGFVGIAQSETEGEVIVFVEDEQTKKRVPCSFKGCRVRTEVTGRIETLSTQVAVLLTGVSEDRQNEVRPLVGGTSLSAYVTKGALIYLYGGTLGMVTYDNKVLSNAHVIAMSPETGEFLDVGTPVIQPGSRDGGRIGNRVGELETYIPIDFGGGTENYADAAIGSIDTDVGASVGEQFSEGDSYWIEGWTEVSKGDIVRKSGRTTGVTTGEVVYTNASVWVTYGDKSAYFVDQIVVEQENWSFAAPGDSGSAVDKGGEFVGLVFAGSETHAVINKAEHIIEGLDIAVELPEGLCSLTISSTPGGSVSIPGEGRYIYAAGVVVDLIAEAGEDYRFVRWTGDVDTIADVNAASTNITMGGNYSVIANFELKEGLCSLTVFSTEGGSVITPGEGTFIYNAEDVVGLIAEADEDYQFVKWTGDVDTVADVYAASTTIAMNASYSITAKFESWYPEPMVLLLVSSTRGGSVTTPGEGAFWYPLGAKVNIVAEAKDSYWFTNWTGDVGAIADVNAASTTIIMDSSYSIRANFEGGGWCFIATAAYGSPMAEEIEILRQFRNEYLLTNPLGQALVDLYYSISLPIADLITEHPSLKPIVRLGLLPAVAVSAAAVNTTPAVKMAMAGLLVLISVAVTAWVMSQRGRDPRYP